MSSAEKQSKLKYKYPTVVPYFCSVFTSYLGFCSIFLLRFYYIPFFSFQIFVFFFCDFYFTCSLKLGRKTQIFYGLKCVLIILLSSKFIYGFQREFSDRSFQCLSREGYSRYIISKALRQSETRVGQAICEEKDEIAMSVHFIFLFKTSCAPRLHPLSNKVDVDFLKDTG